MIFYHIDKGFVYGFLHLISQLIFRMVYFFNRPFYQVDEGSDTALFFLLNYTFFFSFLIHNYDNWKSTYLIQEDCGILKFQNRYFAIQNTFLKFLPNHINCLNFFKAYTSGKSESSLGSFENDSPENQNPYHEEIVHGLMKKSFDKKNFLLEYSKSLEFGLIDVKNQLEEQLNIVEKQKFKKIYKNRGMSPFIQLWSIYYLLFIACGYMVISAMCLVKINTSYDYGGAGYVVIFIMIFLLNMSEILVLPLLFNLNLKRKDYLDHEKDPILLEIDEEERIR